MSTAYSQIVDPELIEKTVADEYQYEARISNSGIGRVEGVPKEGTQLDWIKETLFDGTQGDGQGQSLGVNSQITLESKVQAQYALPIVTRGNGAELDDIADAIVAKRGADDISLEVTNAVSRDAAQIADWIMSSAFEGCMLYTESAASNFLDAGANTISLPYIAQALATRGEKYLNITERGGYIVTRSGNAAALKELGLVAATTNTMGNMKQNEIVEGGMIGTLMGMTLFVTDKISAASGDDQYTVFVEKGALRVLLSPIKVDPIQRMERAYKDVIKYHIRGGAMIDGIYWTTAATNIVTNTNLRAAANYSIAKTYWDDVPMVVLRTDNDTDYPA